MINRITVRLTLILLSLFVVFMNGSCSSDTSHDVVNAKSTATNENVDKNTEEKKNDEARFNKSDLSIGPIYTGMCDASAAVAIDNTHFIVANDEDNSLRIYSSKKAGAPLDTIDLSQYLKPKAKRPETDIEGAAWLGEYVFWITSHGRNKDAKKRPNRYRFFATKIEQKNNQFKVLGIGTPYSNLASDLIDDQRLKQYQLAKAAKKAPKAKDALNIEGLCATADKKLLIAFRNPIHKGQALIVPLNNPLEILQKKAAAKFGDPITLDLDGLGVRSMEYDAITKQYLIIAGPYKSGGKSRLYLWSGKKDAVPVHVKSVDFRKLNPESIFIYPAEKGRQIQILSDDGTKIIDDQACKAHPDKSKRIFRSVWLKLK